MAVSHIMLLINMSLDKISSISLMMQFQKKNKINIKILLKTQERKPIRSDHIRSVAQSCPTLCDPMNRSTPGLPVHHQLPEFTETQFH